MKIYETENKFARSRKFIAKTLKNDQDLYIGYQSNIAMYLYDKFGGDFLDYDVRNNAAKDILKILFGD